MSDWLFPHPSISLDPPKTICRITNRLCDLVMWCSFATVWIHASMNRDSSCQTLLSSLFLSATIQGHSQFLNVVTVRTCCHPYLPKKLSQWLLGSMPPTKNWLSQCWTAGEDRRGINCFSRLKITLLQTRKNIKSTQDRRNANSG
jgi:hypothetical protein